MIDLLSLQHDSNTTSNQKLLYIYKTILKYIHQHDKKHRIQQQQHDQHLSKVIEKLIDKIRNSEIMMININDDVNKLLLSNDKLTKKVEYIHSNTKATVEAVLSSIDDIQVHIVVVTTMMLII